MLSHPFAQFAQNLNNIDYSFHHPFNFPLDLKNIKCVDTKAIDLLLGYFHETEKESSLNQQSIPKLLILYCTLYYYQFEYFIKESYDGDWIRLKCDNLLAVFPNPSARFVGPNSFYGNMEISKSMKATFI